MSNFVIVEKCNQIYQYQETLDVDRKYADLICLLSKHITNIA